MDKCYTRHYWRARFAPTSEQARQTPPHDMIEATIIAANKKPGSHRAFFIRISIDNSYRTTRHTTADSETQPAYIAVMLGTLIGMISGPAGSRHI